MREGSLLLDARYPIGTLLIPVSGYRLFLLVQFCHLCSFFFFFSFFVFRHKMLAGKCSVTTYGLPFLGSYRSVAYSRAAIIVHTQGQSYTLIPPPFVRTTRGWTWSAPSRRPVSAVLILFSYPLLQYFFDFPPP